MDHFDVLDRTVFTMGRNLHPMRNGGRPLYSMAGKIAKQVFESLWNDGGDADAIIEAKGLKQETDTGAIETIVDHIIAANPDQASQYLTADENKRKKLVGFFVGQIMKASKGKANPQLVNDILAKKLV